jgi:tripartite-type tricarboxylate transporter receptor subunit TctC
MTLSRRKLAALAPASLLAALLPGATRAQSTGWMPQRPVKLVISGGPGSVSDVTGRLVAAQLSPALHQPIVCDNQPGAGGMVASDMAARSAPDGHTWTLLSSAASTMAAISKSLPFDPVKSFSWISTLAVYPIVLSVPVDSPIRDFPDLIRRAKAEPGKISYSSVGKGSAYHFIGEWTCAESGAEMLHVPFRSGAAPLMEVLGGRVDVMIDSAAATITQVRAGKLRALAVTSPARNDQYPGVPAISEFYPDLKYESWLALVCAARTPPEIVTRLNHEVKLVLEDPKVRTRMLELGQRATYSTSEETQARMQSGIDRFSRIVVSRNIERQ